MFKINLKIKKLYLLNLGLLACLSLYHQPNFNKSHTTPSVKQDSKASQHTKKQVTENSLKQNSKANQHHKEQLAHNQTHAKRNHRSAESLPVIAIDIHGTFMYQQSDIAVKELLKAGPVNMLRFLRRYHRYKKARDQNVTELPSVEEFVTKKNTGGRYEKMVQKAMSCYLPIPSAVLQLQQLKLDGYKLFIFSNIGSKSYNYLVNKFPELFKLFDGAVITPAGETAKVSPNAYHRCIKIITETLGYEPNCIVLFDDYQPNCIMARSVDPRFIPVLCNRKNIAHSYKELLNTLEKIQTNRKNNLSDTVRTLNIAN